MGCASRSGPPLKGWADVLTLNPQKMPKRSNLMQESQAESKRAPLVSLCAHITLNPGSWSQPLCSFNPFVNFDQVVSDQGQRQNPLASLSAVDTDSVLVLCDDSFTNQGFCVTQEAASYIFEEVKTE